MTDSDAILREENVKLRAANHRLSMERGAALVKLNLALLENALLRQYAVLLGEEVDSAVSMAHIHGWRSTDERIQEGKRLRKELGVHETADLRQT